MKQTKKNVILEKAAVLFRKKGYVATSMRDLAKEVGMEAASLYNHISSKQEILNEILLEISGYLLDGMEQIEKSQKTPIDKIRAIISLHIRATVNYSNSMSLIAHEWRHLDENNLLLFNARRTNYEKRFKAIIIQGIFLGQIKKVNSEIALFSILSSLRWFYDWHNKQKGYTVKDLEKQFSDILIGGLKLDETGRISNRAS